MLPSRPHASPCHRCIIPSQRTKRLEAGRKQLAAKLAKLKAGGTGEGTGGDSGEYGISWGFDEDAIAEEDEGEGDNLEGVDGEVRLAVYRWRSAFEEACTFHV